MLLRQKDYWGGMDKVDFDNTGYDCYLKYVLILNEKFLKKVYVLHEPC